MKMSQAIGRLLALGEYLAGDEPANESIALQQLKVLRRQWQDIIRDNALAALAVLGDESPAAITAIDVRKCLLCRADHLQQPIRSYVEDGLPHPAYTHWYTCPIADAPVGLYIEGDETTPVDDFVRDKLDSAMRAGRWLICIAHARPGGGIQHHQKNVDFPRDRIMSRKLEEFANAHLDQATAVEYALDWLVAELARQICPPPKTPLQTAIVRAVPALLENPSGEPLQ